MNMSFVQATFGETTFGQDTPRRTKFSLSGVRRAESVSKFSFNETFDSLFDPIWSIESSKIGQTKQVALESPHRADQTPGLPHVPATVNGQNTQYT